MWYIVTGRGYGDDEATTAKLRAVNLEEALEAFAEIWRQGHQDDSWHVGEPDDDRIIFVDAIFRCDIEPEQIQ